MCIWGMAAQGKDTGGNGSELRPIIEREGNPIWGFREKGFGKVLSRKGGIEGATIVIPDYDRKRENGQLMGTHIVVKRAENLEKFRIGLLGSTTGLFVASPGMAAGCPYVARVDFRLSNGQEISVWAHEHPLGFTSIEWAALHAMFSSPGLHDTLTGILNARLPRDASPLLRSALNRLLGKKPKQKYEGRLQTEEELREALELLKENEQKERN